MTTSPGRAASYSAEFFAAQSGGSRRSAEIIVPLVVQLVQRSSVIDFGCGVGAWVAAFRQYGVDDAQGIDGDYVDRRQLQIPALDFLTGDLSRPVDTGRTFDLAISLE